jgi:hypothetical protein
MDKRVTNKLSREERLAKNLRNNLKRRKDVQRKKDNNPKQ